MQNNNLRKKAMLALLLCVAMPCLQAQVAHIGDILCEGNAIVRPTNYSSSNATAIGVVFYVDNTGQHGWAIALQDAGSFEWGMSGSDTPLVNVANVGRRRAIYDLDGYENTRVVREYSTDMPAFYAFDFESGWYLPAIGQLNYLYANMLEVNASLAVVGGESFETTNYWEYWSSTEYSAIAACHLDSHGDVFHQNDYKNCSRRVRAAHNF